MEDVITIGAAVRDVILQSSHYKIVYGKQFSSGKAEAFSLGEKVEVEKLHLDIGGGGINSATTFARQGLKVSYLGKFGTDEPGKEIRKHLNLEHIDTSLVIQDEAIQTGYSTILSVPSGERTVLVYRSKDQMLQRKEIPFDSLNANWFYISSTAGNITVLKALIMHAKKNRIKVALNPGNDEIDDPDFLPLIAEIDVLLLNQEEAMALVPKKLQKDGLFQAFAGLTKAKIIITNGTKGAACCDGRKTYYVPVAKRDVVNRLGAGDAFGSGFISGLIRRDGDIHFALQLAATNASSVCMQYGASEGALYLHDPILNLPIKEAQF